MPQRSEISGKGVGERERKTEDLLRACCFSVHCFPSPRFPGHRPPAKKNAPA